MPMGIPFDPPLVDVENALKLNFGNITATAKMLGVVKGPLYEYIARNPSLNEIIKQQRGNFDNHLLDLAEKGLQWCMENIESNSKVGLDAVKFTLDRKGKSRGYIGDNQAQQTTQKSSLDKISEKMDPIYDEIRNGNKE